MTPPIKNFKNFLYLVWQHLNLPDPTPVQYDIADYLQHGPRRSVIEAFRGVGKSWATSTFVCFLLLCDPQLKIMVVSASKERADSFSNFTKRLIAEIPMLRHLKPRANQRDSSISFDVGPAKADHSPSVKSVGITGQLTGSRADVIISDDVEVPNNSATHMMRQKLSEAIKEFDAVLKPGGRVIYLGTPQTEMSIYNTLPERGYEPRIWPARYPQLDKIPGYKGFLAPWIEQHLQDGKVKPGDPVDPLRFNDLDLREREASYGRSGFALQFMLDTTLSDGDRFPLKLSDLTVMNLHPDHGPTKVVWSKAPELCIPDLPSLGLAGDFFYRPMFVEKDFASYSGTVMAIDPSGRGRDETAYAVVKMLHGQLFLVDIGGFRDGYSEATLESLAKVAKRHKVNFLRIEANFGDGMFLQLLKPYLTKIYPCTAEEGRSHGQKELRIIDTLEPVLNQHKLVVDEAVIRKDSLETQEDPSYSLFHQMTRITKDRGALAHDDRLDALAMAVSYWVEQMGRDMDEALESYRERQLDAELQRFMDHAVGMTPRPNTWVNTGFN